MWLSLSCSHFFFSFIIIIIIFLCLFYSLIHTLYTIMLEWSFHFFFSLFHLRVCVYFSYSVRVQSQIRVVSSSSIYLLFFVYLWMRSTEKTL